MKKVKILVDYQNDFVTGVLGCGEVAVALEDPIFNKIQCALSTKDIVMFTRDLHLGNEYKDSFESTLYPEHCMGYLDKNRLETDYSNGAEFYGKLNSLEKDVIVVNKPTNMPLRIEEYFEPFYNWGEEMEIEIFGIATNICVLTTALYLRNVFYHKNVSIIVNGTLCTSFDLDAHAKTLEVLKSNGIKVI